MGALRKVGVGVAGLFGVLALGLCGVGAYASMMAEGKLQFPDTPLPSLAASSDPELIAQGEYILYGPGHCHSCHGPKDRDDLASLVDKGPLSGGLLFDMGPIGRTWAANLTPDPATGIGARSDGELARTIRTGVLHDGSYSIFMTMSAARLSDQDIVAVLSYLRASAPVENQVPRAEWGLLGKVMVTFTNLKPRSEVPQHVPAAEEPSIERGRYLVEHAAFCGDCHSPFDMATMDYGEPRLGGGTPEPSHGQDSDHEFAAPNLTSAPTGITGRLTEDAFVARLHGGRVYESSIMPWEDFMRVSDSDLRSVYRYLKTVPPVDRDTGPVYRKVGWKAGDPS